MKKIIKKEKSLLDRISFLSHYYEWRLNVMRRDEYYCQNCKKKGRQKTVLIFPDLPVLHVHHIKPFKEIVKENNITNEKEALLCDKLWDVSNGITLCVECHQKTDNFGK